MIITDDKDKIIKAYKKEQVEYTNKFIDMQEEIERLNNDIKMLLKENENKEKVIKAQDNIIKEVREKILSVQIPYLGLRSGKTLIATLLNDILKILDKENSNE